MNEDTSKKRQQNRVIYYCVIRSYQANERTNELLDKLNNL